MSEDLRPLVEIALAAAKLAGEIVRPLFREGTPVELKADRTPVTAADRRAEEAVRAHFARETPTFGVIGEEFGETKGDGRHRWVVDPIDGTKAFINRVPLFGSLIALERDGEPVLGVIACHAVEQTAWGAIGLGAWCNGVRARVSSVATLEEATVLTTSIQRWRTKHRAAFDETCDRAFLLRTWGDCFGYLQVATGRADVMFDPDMNLWDVAALAPVIREAGGTFTTREGDYALGESSVATNGSLHPEMLRILHG